MFEDAPPNEFPNLKFQPDSAIGPVGSYPGEPIMNSWWIVHPTKGLVYHMRYGYAYPQANINEKITRMLGTKLYPWAEIKFFEMVFMSPELKAGNDRINRIEEMRAERELIEDAKHMDNFSGGYW